MADTKTEPMIHEDALPGSEAKLEPKPDWEPRFPGSGRLKDKVAIVTGGGSGFGEGIARRFAEEGAKVVIADINTKGAKGVAKMIETAGGSALAVNCDVTKKADWAKLAKETTKAFKRIDIVVNNAGMPQRAAPMLGTDERTFDKIFAVNVKSIYWSAQTLLPIMRKQGGGAFVNIASTAGVRPRPNLVWYNASKGAVITMTKSMAVEWGRFGINVNAICPGYIGTEMNMAYFNSEQGRQLMETLPRKRFGKPEDLDSLLLLLAAEESHFINGAIMNADDGISAA